MKESLDILALMGTLAVGGSVGPLWGRDPIDGMWIIMPMLMVIPCRRTSSSTECAA
jgi:hypothetical protein